MEFNKLLQEAKNGSSSAKGELFLMYRPLIIRRSMLEGCFSEELYQELSMTFLHCIELFRADEIEKRLK